MTPIEVEIWSDVVCPWCYIGKRRFEKALAGFAHRASVVVTWRAFELNPAAPRSYEGLGTYAERLASKYGMSVPEAQARIDQMTATAASEGLTFNFGISRTGNTFDAHRLLHHAGTLGLQDALKERLLRACFTEGEPISDPDTLVRLAGDAGMSERAAREALAGETGALEVRADEARARALRISGVPFFLFDGRYGVSGAQSPEVLRAALEQAASEKSLKTAAGTR